MQHSITLLLLTVLLLAALPVSAQIEGLNIIATTTQAGDLARMIGGEQVTVTQLMGGGVDPHLYRFTEADVTAMAEADLVIYSGLHLEGRIDDVLEEIGRRTEVYALADPIEQQGFTLAFAAQPELPDPHFWFDPRNWQLAAEGLAAKLGEVDPDNAEIYTANADAYIAQLELLYTWGVEAMALVPEEQRVLVTSHDAFQYFGDAFGWEVRGLQGISTEDEAGVGDIQELVDFVIEREIPTMFIESSVPPDTIEAVQNAAQDRGWEVTIGGELYSDAMGEAGTFGGTYIGMIRENVEKVLVAFGYADELPEWSPELPDPETFAEASES